MEGDAELSHSHLCPSISFQSDLVCLGAVALPGEPVEAILSLSDESHGRCPRNLQTNISTYDLGLYTHSHVYALILQGFLESALRSAMLWGTAVCQSPEPQNLDAYDGWIAGCGHA